MERYAGIALSANCRDDQDRRQPCGLCRYFGDLEACRHDDEAAERLPRNRYGACKVVRMRIKQSVGGA